MLSDFNASATTDQIIRLCSKTLKLYDKRLIEHGERVALIAFAIYKQLDKKELINPKDLILLSVFHDIGAYKTEEIDRMVEFETENTDDHSIYGYLFLKYFTPLGDLAQAILYHHTDADKLVGDGASIYDDYRVYSNIIFLADRIDIAIVSGKKKEEIKDVVKPEHFYDELYAVVEDALHDDETFEKVISNECDDFIFNLLKIYQISNHEAFEYLKMLVYSIDFISQHTLIHSLTTTSISLQIAVSMALDSDEINKIYFGALVHDIGKMGIPQEILEKPGRLTDEEMANMRSHVEHTESVLFDTLKPEIAKIAIRHHERLDGSGYPYGLSGDELSTAERIVAVADIVSALAGKRSYKEPFEKEKTFSIIRDMAEKNFIDKKAVDIAIDEYDEIMDYVHEVTNPIIEKYHNMQNEYISLTGSQGIFTDE